LLRYSDYAANEKSIEVNFITQYPSMHEILSVGTRRTPDLIPNNGIGYLEILNPGDQRRPDGKDQLWMATNPKDGRTT
jgi:hypothetical protein